jgi:hypothetical protein
LEQTAQTVISDAVKKVVRSPISSKDGLYGVLKGGAYLNPAKMLPIPDVADHLRKVTLAMCTNLVLRSLVNMWHSILCEHITRKLSS